MQASRTGSGGLYQSGVQSAVTAAAFLVAKTSFFNVIKRFRKPVA
jgi:hypothetical protein